MIISKTPLRISFFSGGSDMPSFFTKETGAALSATINKYIYVITHETPHIGIKTMYDEVEIHSDISNMQHSITKETLKYFNIEKEQTIASISDILSKGSGLGSSSAFTVGLFKNLEYISIKNKLGDYYSDNTSSSEFLAEMAYEIERNRCGFPVGKQDQFAAAYGGFNLFEFRPSYNNVTVFNDPLVIEELSRNLILVYSGFGRSASAILQKQQEGMATDITKFNAVRKGRDKAYEGIKYLKARDLDSFGNLFHEAWMDKKATESSISNEYFDVIYDKAIKAGAIGGKLLGAGGGGFFLFYVKPHKRDSVIESITKNTDCKVYDFKFVSDCSKIVNP